MSSKAVVLSFVDDLSLSQADSVLAGQYFEDIAILEGKKLRFADVLVLDTPKGVSVYTPPEDTIDVLAVFYGPLQLSPASVLGLESVNPEWRDELGSPLAFTTDEEARKSFRVYPTPDVEGGVATGQGLLGESVLAEILLGGTEVLGAGFPDNRVSIIRSWPRGDIVESFADISVALQIIALEFSRESDHTNTEFANQW